MTYKEWLRYDPAVQRQRRQDRWCEAFAIVFAAGALMAIGWGLYSLMSVIF